jgi:hypothetical protein
MTTIESLPSFAERRALFGQAHDATIPEARGRAQSGSNSLQEFLDLWSAILQAHADPKIGGASLSSALDNANDVRQAGSEPLAPGLKQL